MFRYRYALIVLAVCLVPAIAKAQAHGPWELELGGTGQNSSRFNGVTASGNGALSYFFTDQFEFGVRQSVGYSDIGSTAWSGTTALALDFNLPLGDQGQIMPYFGGDVGYIYGDAVHNSWVGGPEAGIKVFLNNSTFIYASIAWDIFFDKHSTTSVFSDGLITYGLGLGVRF
ncbi:MAG TPA: hypothetical protein VHY37_01655 [Tepidisphaeraceae bacterium]|jgi:hypothetical protein|nr:hypothetical protein [Tepidisphaeraceae bacterium]